VKLIGDEVVRKRLLSHTAVAERMEGLIGAIGMSDLVDAHSRHLATTGRLRSNRAKGTEARPMARVSDCNGEPVLTGAEPRGENRT
jgi:hypothetical protein